MKKVRPKHCANKIWGSLEIIADFFMHTAINGVFVVHQMMECPTSLLMVDFERGKLTNRS